MLEIMEKYGWDYHTYMSQPEWVVELIRKKMALEAKMISHAMQK